MAAQFVVTLMQGHPGVAAWALAEPAAVMAEQGGGEATSVEVDQNLLAGAEGLADGPLQWAGYAGVQRAALDIQAQEARRLCIAGPLRPLEQRVAAAVGVVKAFQRGRCRTKTEREVRLP